MRTFKFTIKYVHHDEKPAEKISKFEDSILRGTFIKEVKDEFGLTGDVALFYNGKIIDQRKTPLCDIMVSEKDTLDPGSGKLEVMVDLSTTVADGGTARGGWAKAKGNGKTSALGGSSDGGKINSGLVRGGNSTGGDAMGPEAAGGGAKGGLAHTAEGGKEVQAGDAEGGQAKHPKKKKADK